MVFTSLLLMTIAVTLCLTWAIKFISRKIIFDKKTQNIPTVSGSKPILGHLPILIGTRSQFWERLKEKTIEVNDAEGICKFSIGPIPLIGVCDPKLVPIFLNTFLHKNLYYDSFKFWLGDGIFTASGKKWNKHRKIVSKTFSQHILNEYLLMFNKQATVLVNILEGVQGKGDVDIRHYLQKASLGVSCQTTMGAQSEERVKGDEKYIKYVEEALQFVIDRTQSPWLYGERIYNLSGLKRKIDILMPKIRGVANKILIDRKQQLKENFDSSSKYSNLYKKLDNKTSLLDQLLVFEANEAINETDVLNNINTIIFASFETTSSTLLYILIMLGTYSDVQKKAREEINKIVGERDLTKDDLPNLVFIEAVIKETLRLYPVVPMIIRYADKEAKIDKYIIPAGTNILVPLWVMSKNKQWGDPDVFRPERWSDVSSLPSYNAMFSAFSFGKRNCVGRVYAMMLVKVMLVHILRRYKITADESKLKVESCVTLQPCQGFEVSINKI